MKPRIPTTDELARPKVRAARLMLERFERRLERLEGKDMLGLDDGTQASDATGWLACALLTLQGKSIDGADDLVEEVQRTAGRESEETSEP